MSTRVKYLSCFCCCSVYFGFCFHSTLVSQSCLDNNATCLAFFYFTSRSSLTILDFFLIHYYFSELRHTQPLKRDTQTKKYYSFYPQCYAIWCDICYSSTTAWLVQTGYRTFSILLWLGPLAFVSNAFSFIFFLLSDDVICFLL